MTLSNIDKAQLCLTIWKPYLCYLTCLWAPPPVPRQVLSVTGGITKTNCRVFAATIIYPAFPLWVMKLGLREVAWRALAFTAGYPRFQVVFIVRVTGEWNTSSLWIGRAPFGCSGLTCDRLWHHPGSPGSESYLPFRTWWKFPFQPLISTSVAFIGFLFPPFSLATALGFLWVGCSSFKNARLAYIAYFWWWTLFLSQASLRPIGAVNKTVAKVWREPTGTALERGNEPVYEFWLEFPGGALTRGFLLSMFLF